METTYTSVQFTYGPGITVRIGAEDNSDLAGYGENVIDILMVAAHVRQAVNAANVNSFDGLTAVVAQARVTYPTVKITVRARG